MDRLPGTGGGKKRRDEMCPQRILQQQQNKKRKKGTKRENNQSVREQQSEWQRGEIGTQVNDNGGEHKQKTIRNKHRKC